MTEHVENHGGKQPGQKDCGCGCDGAGDCGDKSAKWIAPRRRFLAGGVALSTFTASLASRRALAGSCANLTSQSSPTHASHAHDAACFSGKSPGFWKEHKACWTAQGGPGVNPASDTFSSIGLPQKATDGTALLGVNFGDKLACAILGNFGDFERQIASAALNIRTQSLVSQPLAYTSLQALVNAIVAAQKANISDTQIGTDLGTTINADTSSATFCRSQGGDRVSCT